MEQAYHLMALDSVDDTDGLLHQMKKAIYGVLIADGLTKSRIDTTLSLTQLNTYMMTTIKGAGEKV